MTEKELLQIGKNNRRMAQLKEKYRELKYDNGIGSRTQDGMPHAQSTSNTSMNSVEEMYDVELEYKELYYKNMKLIQRARSYIEAIPDWVIRLILTLKYINALPEYEVAAAIGITEQECRRILIVHFNNVF